MISLADYQATGNAEYWRSDRPQLAVSVFRLQGRRLIDFSFLYQAYWANNTTDHAYKPCNHGLSVGSKGYQLTDQNPDSLKGLI